MKLTQDLIDTLKKIPQFADLVSDPVAFSAAVASNIDAYVSLLLEFENMDDSHVSDMAGRLAGGDVDYLKNSASKNTLPKLAKALGERRSELVSYLVESSQSGSASFNSASQSVAEQMLSASLRELETVDQTGNGYDFKDGDSFSDTVRWTYLRVMPGEELGSTPFAHYLLAHTLDFMSVQWLSANVSEETAREHDLDFNKDGALCIFSGLLPTKKPDAGSTLERTQTVWRTPRPDGGLGWINDEQWNALAG